MLTPYLDPLPIPPVADAGERYGGRCRDLRPGDEGVEGPLHSELPLTTVWGFDDGTHGAGILGPTIEAHSDQPVTVNWTNDLRVFETGQLRTSHYLPVDTCVPDALDDAQTVFHLHGGHVPAAVDGYPENTFTPGDPPVSYVYPNNQQAGFLWYHDHSLGVTRLNVQMGLAGLYYLRDSVEDALNLPAGEFEVPLILQDRRFNTDGSFRYPATGNDHFFGDKIMVNGKVWPYFDVEEGQVPLPDRERLGLARLHAGALAAERRAELHGDRNRARSARGAGQRRRPADHRSGRALRRRGELRRPEHQRRGPARELRRRSVPERHAWTSPR